MENDVIKIIAEVLGVPSNDISLNTSIGDFPKWDSLGHLLIIQAIQNSYRIEISPREKLMIENVNDIIKIIKSKK